jgi:hypothetical protein
VLDPAQPAHARADRRLRSEPIAWLTTARASSTPIRVRPTRMRVW